VRGELWAGPFRDELGRPVDVPGIVSALENQDPPARREGDKEAGKPNGKEPIQTSTI
jgi:hypothetical protein